MKKVDNSLDNHCTLTWWAMGKKTVFFKGKLIDLLIKLNIKVIKQRRKENRYYYAVTFKGHDITYKVMDTEDQIPYHAKKFIQMYLVKMGDKSTLKIDNVFKQKVTVNH